MLRISHGQIHFSGLAEGIPATHRRQEAKPSGRDASKYRELRLHVWSLYRKRNYLRAGRVGDKAGAIVLEIYSFMRIESNHSAKWKIRTMPHLWKSAGCLFPTNFLTINSYDDNYQVLKVMVLGKGLVSSDTGSAFKEL